MQVTLHDVRSETITPVAEKHVLIQVRSKDLQVKTQLVLRIFILFKVTTCFGLYHQAIIRSQVNNRI